MPRTRKQPVKPAISVPTIAPIVEDKTPDPDISVCPWQTTEGWGVEGSVEWDNCQWQADNCNCDYCAWELSERQEARFLKKLNALGAHLDTFECKNCGEKHRYKDDVCLRCLREKHKSLTVEVLMNKLDQGSKIGELRRNGVPHPFAGLYEQGDMDAICGENATIPTIKCQYCGNKLAPPELPFCMDCYGYDDNWEY